MNQITTDFAALNCILNLMMITFASLAIVYQEKTKQREDSILYTIFTIAAVSSYILQVVDFLLSKTFNLLRYSDSFEDYSNFKSWLIDLKKCRPTIAMIYKNNINTE